MKKKLTLTYPNGLHARPSTTLFHLLKNFDCKVWLIYQGKKEEADNLLGVLSMGVQPGEIEFEAKGLDAENALVAMEQFIHKLNTQHTWD